VSGRRISALRWLAALFVFPLASLTARAAPPHLEVDVRLDPATREFSAVAELARAPADFRFVPHKSLSVRSANRLASGKLRIEYGGVLPALERSIDFRGVLRALPRYRGHDWENGSQDGYADAIESALYLVNREPVPEALDWIESETARLIAFQQEDGIVERWYGDGNALLREDGAYGPVAVAADLDGNATTPDFARTLRAPGDPHTHVWQVESGISKIAPPDGVATRPGRRAARGMP